MFALLHGAFPLRGKKILFLVQERRKNRVKYLYYMFSMCMCMQMQWGKYNTNCFLDNIEILLTFFLFIKNQTNYDTVLH